jgi:hypothetical protein
VVDRQGRGPRKISRRGNVRRLHAQAVIGCCPVAPVR